MQRCSSDPSVIWSSWSPACNCGKWYLLCVNCWMLCRLSDKTNSLRSLKIVFHIIHLWSTLSFTVLIEFPLIGRLIDWSIPFSGLIVKKNSYWDFMAATSISASLCCLFTRTIRSRVVMALWWFVVRRLRHRWICFLASSQIPAKREWRMCFWK